MRGLTYRMLTPLLSAGLLALLLLVILGTARRPDEDAPVAAARAAASGSWYCAVGEVGRSDTLTLIGASQDQDAASLRLATFSGGAVRRDDEVAIPPRGAYVRRFQGDGQPLGVMGQWWDAPTILSRVWERSAAGEPGGLVEGECEPQPSSTWYLPGVTTVGGAQARLVVSNPFESDAAVGVALLAQDGTKTPELLKNVGIPGRSTRVINLNEHAPELPDLGALVTVRSGRVVVEGWQSLNPAVGGIEGVSLLKLAPQPATSWTVPWFSGASADSWLWVGNVGTRPAALHLTVHIGGRGIPAGGLEELVVPPGAVRRVDLRGVLPRGVATGAITATSLNGVPVVVSGATQVQGSTVARTGFTVQLGRTAPDSRWTLASSGTRDRQELVHVVNPTGQPAVVAVRITAPGVSLAPPALQQLAVPAGATVEVDVSAAAPELDAHAVSVTAMRGQVVVGMHATNRTGRLALVAHPAVPSLIWTQGAEVRPVTFTPGLSQRVGTRLGPSTATAPGAMPRGGRRSAAEPPGN